MARIPVEKRSKDEPREFLLACRACAWSIEPVEGSKGRAKNRDDDLVSMTYKVWFDPHPDLKARMMNTIAIIRHYRPKAKVNPLLNGFEIHAVLSRIEANDLIVNEALPQSTISRVTLRELLTRGSRELIEQAMDEMTSQNQHASQNQHIHQDRRDQRRDHRRDQKDQLRPRARRR